MAERQTPTGGDCRALLEQLFGYLDRELGAREQREIERHLAECHCCGPFAESLRRTIAICRDAGAPEVPAAVRRKARARVKALLEKQRQK